jgi:hypothetical protein
VSLEIHAILTDTLGEHAPSYATVINWVAQFKRGYFSTFFFLVGLRTYQHPGTVFKRLSSYRQENTLRLGYQNRYFKIMKGKQPLFLLEKRKEHINNEYVLYVSQERTAVVSPL